MEGPYTQDFLRLSRVSRAPERYDNMFILEEDDTPMTCTDVLKSKDSMK